MFLRIPIAVSLALSASAATLPSMAGARRSPVASVPFELASAYSLSVVPLFI